MGNKRKSNKRVKINHNEDKVIIKTRFLSKLQMLNFSGEPVPLVHFLKARLMMYASWDMEHDRYIFLAFWAIFRPFIQLLTLKIKFWKKCKKKHGDIIFLQKCTINEDHMMYVSWDIRYEGQRFVSFGDIFCFLTPLTTRKIEILIKWKKPGDMIILHLCATNGDDMVYGSWDMERDGQNVLSIWTISCHFTPLRTLENQNFEKMKNSAWRYHHFTQVYQKLWSDGILFLRYSA